MGRATIALLFWNKLWGPRPCHFQHPWALWSAWILYIYKFWSITSSAQVCTVARLIFVLLATSAVSKLSYEFVSKLWLLDISFVNSKNECLYWLEGPHVAGCFLPSDIGRVFDVTFSSVWMSSLRYGYLIGQAHSMWVFSNDFWPGCKSRKIHFCKAFNNELSS